MCRLKMENDVIEKRVWLLSAAMMFCIACGDGAAIGDQSDATVASDGATSIDDGIGSDARVPALG